LTKKKGNETAERKLISLFGVGLLRSIVNYDTVIGSRIRIEQHTNEKSKRVRKKAIIEKKRRD